MVRAYLARNQRQTVLKNQRFTVLFAAAIAYSTFGFMIYKPLSVMTSPEVDTAAATDP